MLKTSSEVSLIPGVFLSAFLCGAISKQVWINLRLGLIGTDLQRCSMTSALNLKPSTFVQEILRTNQMRHKYVQLIGV